MTHGLSGLVVLEELLICADAEIALRALEASQVIVAEPWYGLSLALNALVAVLAHVVLSELADGGLIFRNVSVMHASGMNGLAVANAVLGCANRLAAVGADDAFVVKVKR